MNAMFGTLTTEGLEESTDRVGGYGPRDSGIYTGTIKAMYAGESPGGAKSVTVLVDLEDGREYRETIYITDRTGKNWFANKQDPSKKVPLPGFTTIDDICLVTTGEPLASQSVEDKILNIYDVEQKKEMHKSVPVLTGTIGKQVTLGIVRQMENKSEKDGSGNYVPVADTREINFIDKVFHTQTKMTVVEARNGAETAVFHDTWAERNKGQTRDKRTIKDGEAGKSGRPGATPSASSAAPRKSLFGA